MEEQPLPPENVVLDTGEPAAAAPAGAAGSRGEELSLAMLRLLVGGTLEGREQVAALLRRWQAEAIQDDQTASPQSANAAGQAPVLRSLLISALFGASRTAHRRLASVQRMADSAARLSYSLLRPFTRRTPLHSLEQRFDRLVQRGQEELDQWVRQGQVEELHSRRMLQHTLRGSVGEAVSLLSTSDQVSQLIKDQIGLLAEDLPRTPEVDALLQKMVDKAVDYIQENPTQVQEIVQGQSTSMADEISDEVRERMVTADNVFELFIRSLLRRPLREELPPPRGEIRQRALRARTPDDARHRH